MVPEAALEGFLWNDAESDSPGLWEGQGSRSTNNDHTSTTNYMISYILRVEV